MTKIRYIYKLFIAFALVSLVSGCGDMFDLDINEDPNNPGKVNSDLLLAQSEYGLMNSLAGGVNNNLMGFMGILASADSWQLGQGSYNGFWASMYANHLKDLEGIIAANTEGVAGANPRYLGIAQLLKAYALSVMVDLFGDIPYSEALQGDNADKAIRSPKFDDDKAVYDEAFKLADAGLANLAKTAVAIRGDIIYGGDAAKWIKFGNTLKLRMLINTRLVDNTAKDKIQTLLNEGKLILADADDFTFQFSKVVTPDNRHPWYQSSYTTNSNGFTYILHQYMVEMLDDADPRWGYYFKRQQKTVLDQNNDTERNTTPCSQTPGCTYGYVVLNAPLIDQLYTQKGLTYDSKAKDFLAGIFGRDRGDPAGVPLDGPFRTYPGVYPAGGYFDGRDPGTGGTNVAGGGGIFPAITSVNTLYYQIEAILALGVPGDARALFDKAIRAHINKVVNFSVASDSRSVRPPYPLADGRTLDIDKYVTLWLQRYDGAASNDARLNVVFKQLYFSSWGNGYDLYNAYRRTGFPNTLQEPLYKPRNFPLRLPYPQEELTLNPQASSYKTVVYDRDRIFWDPN